MNLCTSPRSSGGRTRTGTDDAPIVQWAHSDGGAIEAPFIHRRY